MPNGKRILSELEFEQHISRLDDRGLIEFVARQQYQMSLVCPVHEERLIKVEKRTRKWFGISGGSGAAIGVFVTAMIDYFTRRG